MPAMPASPRRLALAIAAALPLAAAAQTASPSPQRAPLAGPRVAPSAPAAPTIVARDADGRVVIPDHTPEEAALDALGLDSPDAPPSERAARHAALDAARRVLATRRTRLDEFVMKNVPLLTSLGAGSAGKLEQAALVHKAYTELAPIREGGTLQQQIASALGPAHAPRFDALLKDFWNAVARDRAGTLKPDGKPVGRLGAVANVKLESLGREIERAFLRVSQSGEIIYRYLTQDLTLRDDQALKLRTLVADFIQRGGAEGNAKDAPATFLAAFSLLDDAQRPIFARNLKRLSGK